MLDFGILGIICFRLISRLPDDINCSMRSVRIFAEIVKDIRGCVDNVN
jgi:hypothetical protein